MTEVTPVTEVTDVESPELLFKYASPTSLVLPAGLDLHEWTAVGGVLRSMERSVMWWIGDWWRYGERSYGEAAVMAAPTGYSVTTCQEAARVAERFELPRRLGALTWTHHQAVASLEPGEQDELLAKAAADEMGTRELRAEVRRMRTARRIGKAAGEAAALESEGIFQVLYVDPPWRYEHAEPTRAIENNYPTMALEEICALEVPAAEDSVLFLWATSPKLSESLEVVDAWGFTYRTCMVWVKDKIGMGYYARQQHELVLIANRKSLHCHYLAYVWPQVNHGQHGLLIPFQLLRAAYEENKQSWFDAGYFNVNARNKDYTTRSFAVPRDRLVEDLSVAMTVYFDDDQRPM